MRGVKWLLILVLSFLLTSCGGGAGGPGSSGTGDTNIIVSVDIMPSQYGIGYTMDQEKCQLTELKGSPDYNVNLTTTPVNYRLINHVATIFIKASLISPLMEASPLYVEKYTVRYTPSLDSIGAPPIAAGEYRISFVIMPPLIANFTTLNCKMVFPAPDIIFFDSMRKMQYMNDVLSGRYSFVSGNYLNRYTATFTFSGKNAEGKEFSFVVQSDFQIGLF